MYEAVVISSLANATLLLAGIQTILAAYDQGDRHLTISDFSVHNDMAYLCLFTSVLSVSVYLLTTTTDVLYQRCAIMGLFIIIPCKGMILSTAHITGVVSVVGYSIMELFRMRYYILVPMVVSLVAFTIRAILYTWVTDTVLCECVLFIFCSNLLLMNSRIE